MGAPITIALPPGYVEVDSPLATTGRYIGGDGIRFVRGKPEKIGGYIALTTMAMAGIIRDMHCWSDLTSRLLIAAGTSTKLYSTPNTDFVPIDITPQQSTQVVSNPFTTTNGSPTVKVSIPSHDAEVGQVINTSGASAVGGLTLNGAFPIASVIDGNNVTITAGSNATSGATGGGSVTISVELVPGISNPVAGLGWGVGPWSGGTWGTPRTSTTVEFLPRVWALGNFGKLLLAAPMGGQIYQWDPTTSPTVRATALGNGSPTIVSGFWITSERFVIAFGSNNAGPQDLMELWWSAQGDLTDWDVTEISGALGAPSGTRTIQEGTRIVAAAEIAAFISVIWTDTAIYTHQYTGSSSTFSTLLAGTNCGLIGPNAFVAVNGMGYWVAAGGFMMYNGSVSFMPNFEDIQGIFKRIPNFYAIKTTAYYRAQFQEIWFEFVVDSGNEPTFACVYNVIGQFWFTCSVNSTAETNFIGTDTRPIKSGVDGILYQHDNGLDANGVALPWSLVSAPFDVSAGARSVDILGFMPDTERLIGEVALTTTAYDRMPEPSIEVENDTFGPTDGLIDMRICGRELSFEMSCASLGCDFRMGAPRIEFQPSAGRR